jgi:hypothetical protein
MINLKANFVYTKRRLMYSRCWLVIKDDSKRTFEVFGQASNDNALIHKMHSMQKAGMNVSSVTPPVSNKASSKDLVKITGYTKEDGLNERLEKEYREITKRSSLEHW